MSKAAEDGFIAPDQARSLPAICSAATPPAAGRPVPGGADMLGRHALRDLSRQGLDATVTSGQAQKTLKRRAERRYGAGLLRENFATNVGWVAG